jgi:hypothetical protein
MPVGESFARHRENPQRRKEFGMRRHHEELSVLPALSLLLPFAGVLWLRIKGVGRKDRE